MPFAYFIAALALVSPGNAADAIAARFREQVVVEPGLTVPASSNAAARAATIEKAMDALVAEIPGATWRRLYVQTVQGRPVPDARTLADRVRLLEAQSGANMVIERPAISRGTLFMENYAITPSYRSELGRARYRTLYLVFSAKPRAQAQAASQPEQRTDLGPSPVTDVFGDMLATFFSLDQSAQQAGMQQAMTLLQGLDPAARADFVITMWRSMSPELQADVVRSVMRFEQSRGRLP